MPSLVASATKANVRQAVAQHPLVGDWWPGTSTGAGTTTTIVDSGLSGWGDNEFQEWYALQGSGGGAPGEYRIVDSFTASTLTLRTANSVALGNTQAYYLHRYRPDWYTLACNTAIRKLYPSLFRPVTGFLYQPNTSNYLGSGFSLPRNMTEVHRVYRGGILVDVDEFTRADSTTTPGGSWTVGAGTWGISNNRLYSVSDADNDYLYRDFTTKDQYIRAVVRGTLNHASVYSVPQILFRFASIYNTLVLELRNGSADLRRIYPDLAAGSGTESSLTTATVTTANDTEYRVEIRVIGNRVIVWLDGVAIIDYALTGENVNYAENTNVGIRLNKAGSPATAAAVNDIAVFDTSSGEYPVEDWTVDQMKEFISFQHRLSPAHLIAVDGRALLSTLAADTAGSAGAGTIASDTTATLQIATTDAEWELLIEQTASELHRIAIGFANNEQDRAYHAARANEAEAQARAMQRLAAPRRVVARSLV